MGHFAMACAALALASNFEAEDPSHDLKLSPVRLTPNVYLVQGDPGVASAANRGFNSNAAFVATADGVVVIDALGTPALGRALLRAIRDTTDRPVRRVILTHYHADHSYGLGALREVGAEIWAHGEGRSYLESADAQRRVAQRRSELAPWFDAGSPLVPATRWLTDDASFSMGGVRFEIVYLGPAHSPEDVTIVLPDEGVVFSGDILFAGRIPFVGEADSRRWLAAIDRLLQRRPRLLVSGHGPPSRHPEADLTLTRDYLTYLRKQMGTAARDMIPFEQAYAATDWSAFSKLPAFEQANRINAYGTFLTMEREMLETPATR